MKTIISLTPSRIAQNKKALEKKLKVKISIAGKKVEILGEELNEFFASRVLEAIDANFPIGVALMLLDEEFLLEHLNIKDISRRKTNLRDVRARVIGTKGRTIALIGELSDSYLTINDNQVSIIGPVERIEIAMHALKALIRGSKQSSVYTYLEKQRKKPLEEKIEFEEENENPHRTSRRSSQEV